MYRNYDISDVMNSIEGFDLFNSELIMKLDKISEFDEYKISKNIGRLDLISHEKYDIDDFYGLIGILNRIETLDDLSFGKVVKLPSSSDLRNLSGR